MAIMEVLDSFLSALVRQQDVDPHQCLIFLSELLLIGNHRIYLAVRHRLDRGTPVGLLRRCDRLDKDSRRLQVVYELILPIGIRRQDASQQNKKVLIRPNGLRSEVRTTSSLLMVTNLVWREVEDLRLLRPLMMF